MNAMALRGQPPVFKLPSATALLAGAAALSVMAVSGWLLVHTGDEAPMAQVEVEGRFERVTAMQVSEAVSPLLQHSFGRTDLETVREAVEALPWVARARVERRWPSALRVRVWERQAVARWGTQSLLDTQAQVFAPAAAEIPEGLPVLQAPPGHEREILDAYRQLSAALEGSSFQVASLNLDARGEWLARTDTDLELRLGRQQPYLQARLISGALARAVEGKQAQLRYVDLRYSNGFAVGWKADATPMAPQAQQGGEGNG